MNAKMITTMERRRYFKPVTEVINIEMSGKILIMSGEEDTDLWGYVPGQYPTDTEKLA